MDKSIPMREKTNIESGMTVPEIMKKYDVSRVTAWRAKQRGYLYGSTYRNRDDCTATPKQQQKFSHICALPGLNTAALSSVSKQKPHDIAAGRSTLTCGEWQAFRAEIQALKKAIRPFIISGRGIHAIKDHRLVKYYTLFARLPKLCTRLSVGNDVHPDEVGTARELTKEFYDNLKI